MSKDTFSAADIEKMLVAERDDAQRDHLMRFFKTSPGQYGHGDRFLGLKVPQTRAIVKRIRLLVAPDDIERLLYSPWHEARLCALLLMVEEMKANLPKKNDGTRTLEIKAIKREQIAAFYLKHARQANNWDLVDLSCEYILGPYIRYAGYECCDILSRLAGSDNLWEQRISIVTTLDFVRNGVLQPSLEICDMLLSHPHDLIHKAVGWVLREVGKKDKEALTGYLEKNYSRMARTSLRYAIERMDEAERRCWLNR